MDLDELIRDADPARGLIVPEGDPARAERAALPMSRQTRPPRRRVQSVLSVATACVAIVIALGIAALFLSARGHQSTPAAPTAGGQTLVYQVTAGGRTAHQLSETTTILRDRAAVIAPDARITRDGSRIVIAAPSGHPLSSATAERLTEPGRVEFFDWEADVIVPGSHDDQTVAKLLPAGNADAMTISQGGETTPDGKTTPGVAQAGAVTLYRAVLLAAHVSASPATRHQGSHDWAGGNQQYLFGDPGSRACATAALDAGTKPTPGEHCLLAGPVTVPIGASRSVTDALLGTELPSGVSIDEGRILSVGPDTVVMQAAPSSASDWPAYGGPATRYFVVTGAPALGGNELTHPTAGTDQTGGPDVSFGFTQLGGNRFQSLTAQIAQRGELDSIGAEILDQHFAVAIDDQLITVASIDFRTYPDGIAGGAGAEITGDFSRREVDQLAAILRDGVLPTLVRSGSA